jgi:hypothetical protein
MADALNTAGNGSEEGNALDAVWSQLPTETDIYILPDGRVVIADLPVELTSIPSALGVVEACEIAPDAQPDSSV